MEPHDVEAGESLLEPRPSHWGGQNKPDETQQQCQQQNQQSQHDVGQITEASRALSLVDSPIPTALAARLYTSHFLSTWNSRVFEFVVVLFLAAIYPDTLRPMSVYAVVRSVSAIAFAEVVGACIDHGKRLVVVRVSIAGQRAAVAMSCVLFWLMLNKNPEQAQVQVQAQSRQSSMKNGFFALAVLAACVEKLCSTMNLISIERDWVVIMTEGNEDGRRVLNARMRRIDLFCKLVGPLAISYVVAVSTMVAVWTVLAMNVISVFAEYFCIAAVYRNVPALWRRSTPRGANSGSGSGRTIDQNDPSRNSQDSQDSQDSWGSQRSRERLLPSERATALSSAAVLSRPGLRSVVRRIFPLSSVPFYVRHQAFLPSFSLSLLYLTVLSLSGQMVAYLLSVGYSSLAVGLARTASAVFELSATWLAPRLMGRIGAVRGGIWSLSWQSIWLTAGIAWFFAHGTLVPDNIVSATGLVIGVAVSRIGLWGFDLCAQSIVQDEVELEHRGAFSMAEAACQNLFEMISYVTTIVFSRPDQFKWPVLISAAAIYTAAALYTTFVRRRRGHLVHLEIAQRWIDKALSGIRDAR